MPDFPINLKKLRIEKGVTQKQLGNVLNVSQNAIYNWETGKREPNLDMLEKIAAYFGVTVDDLIGINDSPTVSKAEFSDLVRKYRILDADGKETVDFILDKEYKRCANDFMIKNSNGTNCMLEEVRKKESTDRFTAYLNAAHADNYADAPEELKEREENMMDDEDF